MDKLQKILIVDDKKENLFALEQILSQTGAGVIQATNGNQALIETLNHDFALAILDVQMPEMDGYELAEFLRSEPKTKDLPLIFLSAVYSDEFHVFRGYEAGAVDFIVKPVDPLILLGKARVFLQLDSQRRALLKQIELQKAKNYLESILMAVSDSILVISLDGVVQTVNRAALEMLQYNYDGIIGLHASDVIEDNEFLDWLGAIKNHDERTNPTFHRIETELLSASGTNIPVLISGSALINQEGEIQGAVLAAVDISDRKKAEKAIAEYSEQLEIRVDERTRELREAQEKLVQREKLVLLGKLAGSVSHELRNPLGAIKNAAYYLNIALPEEAMKPDILESLGIMNSEIDASERIINNLLDLAYPTPFSRQLIKVNELLKSALSQVEVPENVQLELDFHQELPIIVADPVKLEQAFINIILNGIQAMDTGGRFVICAMPVLNASGDTVQWIRILFSDTGCGISEENKEKIFEPLFSTKAKGIGLGLAQSKAMVEAHHGQLLVESQEGQGSTFTILLPFEFRD